MPPPINPKVLETVDAMCRGVGIEQAILRHGPKECKNLRHNLRKHMRKHQALAASSTSNSSSTAVDLSFDARVLCDFAVKAATAAKPRQPRQQLPPLERVHSPSPPTRTVGKK